MGRSPGATRTTALAAIQFLHDPLHCVLVRSSVVYGPITILDFPFLNIASEAN